MAQVASNSDFQTNTGNRLVWVLNRHHKDYVEEFRGEKLTVPANEAKKLLLPFLAARRFLGQPKAVAEMLPNGEYVTQPKALYVVELSDEEKQKLDPSNIDEDKRVEKTMRLTCTLCSETKTFQTKKALSNHVTKAHPDRSPLSE